MNVFSSHNRSALFFDGKNPNFASSIVLELWRNHAGTPYVKMFVIDGAGESFREFKYCDQLPPDFERINGFCTLESLERAKSMSITDDPIECASEQPTCCPEGGTWSEWATEGDCTTTCGSCSERTRTRTCTSAAYDCPCKGESSEVGPCGISLCPFPATQNCCSPYAKKKNEKTDTFFCGSENEPPYEPC
ncbi:hypothetical protein PMAYCL1PPCAC_05479 [Pristionchus mayeri]|uniref:Uncharacterized protein n=1 Tax=Pristionchus mayeri TaxID=1317129 RepID=A0AAN5CAV0_9BILA|nr:hypothetical protein PMAYCL1PPCAC_05479 [Pristionchus mayeri]